jgi:hypothetical protein
LLAVLLYEVIVKARHFLASPLLGCIMLYPVDGISQDTRAPAASIPAAAGALDGDFGLDDLMTLLIQPRHIKLYYAGTHKNWELAAAEVRDLRSGFARISRRIPKYLNNGVPEAVALMFEPKLHAVDDAIAAADSKRFATAYQDLTAACNACHTYMEHPFLVIKVPNSAVSSLYPDQDFHPSP